MSRETEEWAQAAEAKDPQARWGFDADEISKESHTFIESVRELVTRET
jgi:hypothetical protein